MTGAGKTDAANLLATILTLWWASWNIYSHPRPKW